MLVIRTEIRTEANAAKNGWGWKFDGYPVYLVWSKLVEKGEASITILTECMQHKAQETFARFTSSREERP